MNKQGENKEDCLIEFEHLKDTRTPIGEIAVEKGMLTGNQLVKIFEQKPCSREEDGIRCYIPLKTTQSSKPQKH